MRVVLGIVVAILLLAAVLLAVVPAAEAQAAGMYPYSVFEKKPLAIGAKVWANIGDNRCAYAEQYPSAKDECFARGEYQKAKVVEIFAFRNRVGDERRYAYRIEFERTRANPDRGPRWDAPLDEAYAIYNLPERWAEWSRHFILLNW